MHIYNMHIFFHNLLQKMKKVVTQTVTQVGSFVSLELENIKKFSFSRLNVYPMTVKHETAYKVMQYIHQEENVKISTIRFISLP